MTALIAGDTVNVIETFVAQTTSGLYFKRYVAKESHVVTTKNIDFLQAALDEGKVTLGDASAAATSLLLDALGDAVVGSILTRGPDGWVLLPPGSGGEELVGHGSGMEPSYESDSDGGSRACQSDVTDPAGDALIVGDGQGTPFVVDNAWDGRKLTDVWAAVVGAQSSSGAVTIQIRRSRAGVSADMLSTALTIDANETTSFTAATPAVIDGAHDDMVLGDLIYWDIDGAGTGAKGLVVGLVGEKP
jgi:hypothetical protein